MIQLLDCRFIFPKPISRLAQMLEVFACHLLPDRIGGQPYRSCGTLIRTLMATKAQIVAQTGIDITRVTDIDCDTEGL